MRHRVAASIVCAASLIFALSACGNGQISSSNEQTQGNTGSIVPNQPPTMPHSSYLIDTPQSHNAPPLQPSDLETPLAEFLDTLSGQKGTPWLHVIDATTGEVLAQHNAQTTHTPASTTKILTALSALDHLDENATLTTGTALQGTDLYLWGEGDLLLGTEPTNPLAVNGRASLADLATQTATTLTAQGITSVTLHWAPPPFDTPLRLPQWATQEVADYEGRVAAYAIDAGRSPFADTFLDDPEKYSAQIFAELLQDKGITATLGTQAEKPAEASSIATTQSATLGEQIRYMLAHSDNTMADQYCRLAAKQAGQPTTFAGATRTIADTLTSLNIPADGLALDDCSGLSSKNSISPQTLTSVLYYVAHSPHPNHKNLLRSLPIAGAQGTLARRTFDGEALGNVQAKTGSLGAVTSLAGLVRTTSGREIIFAIGVDGTEDGAAYFMRPAVDQFVQSIADL